MLKSHFSPFSRRFQTGNVLFMILIAVMLFAALTAAVTSSNRGGTTSTRERGTINATDVMSYGSAMEKIVARIMSNEVSESALSFENTIWQYNDDTQIETGAMFTRCTSSDCKIFDPAGGGLDAKTFTAQDFDSPDSGDVKSGHGIIYALSVNGVGSAAQDLVLMIAAIDVNTCMGINTALNIPNPSNAPPADTWAGAVPYDGTFSSAADATGEIGDMATQLVGKSSGCVQRSGGTYGSADNYFYQVLIPR